MENFEIEYRKWLTELSVLEELIIMEGIGWGVDLSFLGNKYSLLEDKEFMFKYCLCFDQYCSFLWGYKLIYICGCICRLEVSKWMYGEW